MGNRLLLSSLYSIVRLFDLYATSKLLANSIKWLAIVKVVIGIN